MLKNYLSKLGNVSVSLVAFNIYTKAPEDFTISSGNGDKLLKRIESLTYDGGTQFGAINLSKYSFDEILLFSDGLSTFGKEDMIIGKSPVTTITTSPSANYSYLKYIAQQTRGSFVDLGKLETAIALKELEGQSLQIINIIYKAAEIDELVTQTTPVLNTGLSFAGKLKTKTADLTIELGFGNEVKMKKDYTIVQNSNQEYGAVKRIWASMAINKMDMEYEKNKESITKLGKEFSIVTQNTSLLVLDRVEDYVEHEIVPPADLQKEYYTLLREKQDAEKDKTKTAFTEAVAAMNQLKDWWKRDFTTRKPVAAVPVPDEMVRFTPPRVVQDAEVAVDDTTGISGAIEIINTAVPFLRISDSVSAGELVLSDSGWGGGIGLTDTAAGEMYVYGRHVRRLNSLAVTPGVGAFNYFTTSTNHDGVAISFGSERQSSPMEPGIELRKWKPDVEYLKTLEHTPAAERLSKYFFLKKEYNSQPSFYVDVAGFFIGKNEKQLGIQILSNISEMKLEDAELLRIVANELLEAGETAWL